VAQPGEDERRSDHPDNTDRTDRPAPAAPPFLGTHHPRLDDKGRLFLPAKFRERLAGGLVITPGQERCLYVFPDAEFARLFEGIRQAPVTSKRARDYQRMFLARASAETPDNQGRVTVPPDLRAYAALSKDCVVVGAGTRVEVWDAEAWTTYAAEQEGAFADRSEEVLPGLI
jgi:MraZ protein